MKRFVFHISLAGISASVSAGVLFGFVFQPSAIAEVAIVEEPEIFFPSASVDETSDSKEPALIATHEFTAPIQEASRRVTKKPFGLQILPGQSPVPNDRFTGFHVGADFETFADEQESDVPIFAVCTGKLLFKKYATGYGGVAVEECQLGGRDVSVIYGHLHLESILAESGDTLQQGERIGLLGRGYSKETDGVRKHLHLGIHEGDARDIRGYVQDESDVRQWRDPLADMAL